MHRISVKLNQQQLQLLDRAVSAGYASDRAELIRRALRELAAKALSKPALPAGQGEP